ncbi:CAP domain-containing protein [Streptomyces luteogriseus]|uniref:CAP domain-containing protein n=1 Tax=Streptomyces luteogriseus TaxID=68233 RepID=UPI002E352E13|nr:CAP domain-containing protein [Streptomyces luteogriseus]WTJ28515.1 CAP domain-containing protein [Streptomyces luteogriseus]
MPPPYQEAPTWPLSAPGPVRPRDSAPHARPDQVRDDVATEVVEAVNRQRAQADCRPLRLRTSLSRAAQRHSADMARSRRLTHTGSDGSSPAARMRDAGYHPGYIAENIAAGPGTPGSVVRTWIGSPEHRDIILTCRYTHAGVGVASGGGGHGGRWTWPPVTEPDTALARYTPCRTTRGWSRPSS